MRKPRQKKERKRTKAKEAKGDGGVKESMES